MPTPNRYSVTEVDRASFVQPTLTENALVCLESYKGPTRPILCSNVSDVLLHFGIPLRRSHNDLVQLYERCRNAPTWVNRIIPPSSVHGGIDVTASGISALTTGRAADFTYQSGDTTQSHGFLMASPSDPEQYLLAIQIDFVSGTTYTYTLFEVINGVNQPITDAFGTGTYSLTEGATDEFGSSIYIEDVFEDHPYLIPIVSTNTITVSNFTSTTTSMTGGVANGTITTSERMAAWNAFNDANNFVAEILLDFSGSNLTEMETVRRASYPYAVAISVVPFASDTTSAAMITYADSLSIESDNVFVMSNWGKVRNPFTQQLLWASGVGNASVRFNLQSGNFNSTSPAGINDGNEGGQFVNLRFPIVQLHAQLNEAQLRQLDTANINPVVLIDNTPTLVGDKTFTSATSDTSFVGTRRVYNYIIRNVINLVLKRQVFKNNDPARRQDALRRTQSIINPVLSSGGISEYNVICDATNNTAEILNARQFLINIFVKATPNSQSVQLVFTRLAQGQVAVDVST